MGIVVSGEDYSGGIGKYAWRQYIAHLCLCMSKIVYADLYICVFSFLSLFTFGFRQAFKSPKITQFRKKPFT